MYERSISDNGQYFERDKQLELKIRTSVNLKAC